MTQDSPSPRYTLSKDLFNLRVGEEHDVRQGPGAMPSLNGHQIFDPATERHMRKGISKEGSLSLFSSSKHFE